MKIEIHLFRCSAIPCFKGSRVIGPFVIGLTALHRFYHVESILLVGVTSLMKLIIKTCW